MATVSRLLLVQLNVLLSGDPERFSEDGGDAALPESRAKNNDLAAGRVW